MSAGMVECQPLAVPEADGYRPACLCGWRHLGAFESRTVAILRAQAHDRRKNPV